MVNKQSKTMNGSSLSGVDIGKVMASAGPIVKCVVLRAKSSKRDFDPSRNLNTMSIREMKHELEAYGSDTSSFVEKNELVSALEEARSRYESNSSPPDSNVPQGVDPKLINKERENNELSHLIDEIEVDTTPRKSMVSKILGGDLTFLGQYEDEGIMVIIRRQDWENAGNDTSKLEIPPENPHVLQPPLHKKIVRGDILLMRVAETDEVLDSDDDTDSGDSEATESSKNLKCSENSKTGDNELSDRKSSKQDEKKRKAEIVVPTNDDFFLDYTKAEYLKFAARTDIVAEEVDEERNDEEVEATEPDGSNDGSEQENEEDDDDNDDAFDPDEEEEDEELGSEEQKVGMMNLILGQILQRFREENGRGPDTLELLEMRKALADKLGVEVPKVDEQACIWEKSSKPHEEEKIVDQSKSESDSISKDNATPKKRSVAFVENEDVDFAQTRSHKRIKFVDGKNVEE